MNIQGGMLRARAVVVLQGSPCARQTTSALWVSTAGTETGTGQGQGPSAAPDAVPAPKGHSRERKVLVVPQNAKLSHSISVMSSALCPSHSSPGAVKHHPGVSPHPPDTVAWPWSWWILVPRAHLAPCSR